MRLFTKLTLTILILCYSNKFYWIIPIILNIQSYYFSSYKLPNI